jgi:hypothetical protein
MIHMTVALVIFTNDPLVNRHGALFCPVYAQIGILIPPHRLGFVFKPDVPAVRKKTTKNFIPILIMTSQNSKRISVTALCKAADIFRTQRRVHIRFT